MTIFRTKTTSNPEPGFFFKTFQQYKVEMVKLLINIL